MQKQFKMYNQFYRNIQIGKLNAIELLQVLKCEALEVLTEEQTDSLLEAADLATALHFGKTRKHQNQLNNSPYIEHPIRNTIRLLRWGVTDLDTLQACVLHDTVEDGSCNFCEIFLNKKMKNKVLAQEQLKLYITEEFGINTAQIVMSVTNPLDLHSSTNKNEYYFEHVSKNIKSSPQTLLVKLSDFIDNAGGLKHMSDTPQANEFAKKQATKYCPMIPVFLTELYIRKANKDLDVSEDGFKEIIFKLKYIQADLEQIIEG